MQLLVVVGQDHRTVEQDTANLRVVSFQQRQQLVAQAVGVLLSGAAWWWYLEVDQIARVVITTGSLLTSASFLTFGLIVGLTFRGSGQGRVVSSSIALKPRKPIASA